MITFFKWWVGLAALVALGCSGVGGYRPAQYEAGGPTQSSDKVQPTFPYAISWNSYVVNDGTTTWNGSGIGCSTTLKTDAVECLHAGEQRKFTMPSTLTSCAGLTAADALGAFDWTCDATGGTVVFYSTGLKAGKGLRDLVDGAALAWRPNSLVIGGGQSLQSATSVWWPNPVLAAPVNSGASDAVASLDSSGAVYVVAASVGTRGFNVGADQVSLVTLGTSSISFVGTASSNCNSTDGTTNSPDISTLVCSFGNKFLWMEFNGSTGVALTSALWLAGAHFSRVLNTFVTGASASLGATNGARVTNLRGSRAGLVLSNVSGSVFTNIQTTKAGVGVYNSNNNVFSNVLASGGYQGMVLQGSSNNVVTRATILGTESSGIELSGSAMSGNILSFLTVVNTGAFALANYNSPNSIFHDVLSANSTQHGWNVTATSSISHAAIFFGQNYGLALSASNNKFSGNLIAGGSPSGDCSLYGSPTAPGIDGSCNGTDLSTGLLAYTGGLSVAASFRGKIMIDDPVNASDVNGGSPTYPAAPFTFDWANFQQTSSGPFELYRTWGADGSVFPNADHRSSWEHLNSSGRIWELSLLATDTVVRNTSGDGVTQNAALVDGAPCPPWLAGSRTLTDATNSVTYLANAFEVMGDGLGNDDGLCESNEACVAAPNFGAYQGDGDWTQHRCVFTDGAVSGVTMYFYPINGR